MLAVTTAPEIIPGQTRGQYAAYLRNFVNRGAS